MSRENEARIKPYQSNQENFPVTGVSWYEARAYAKWSGKKIPTIYHWYRAAMRWGSLVQYVQEVILMEHQAR